MTQEEAIHALKEIKHYVESDNASLDCRKAVAGLDFAISALRPVSRGQLDVVINSLKLRLENNEENGVVSIPKFAVKQMIERLEVLHDD